MDAGKRIQRLASVVLLATAMLLVVLLGRVVWIGRHADAAVLEQLARQHTVVMEVKAVRGHIATADGVRLAESVRVYNLYADPAYIADPDGLAVKIEKLEMKLAGAASEGGAERAKIQKEIDELKARYDKEMTLDNRAIEAAKTKLCEALSPIMNKPAAEIRKELETNLRHPPSDTYPGGKLRRFLWLAREVDETFYEKFNQVKAELRKQGYEDKKAASKAKDKAAEAEARMLYRVLDGVKFVKSFKRVYPQGQLGSSIVGFANLEGGVDAMEHQLEHLLRGIDGQMHVTKDASRRTLNLQDQRYVPADNGRDVRLTVNSVVQGIVEEELEKGVRERGAVSGTVVVMVPEDGRILAMATWPTFDPADYTAAEAVRRRNKAVTDPIEPGSIFKPVIMGWAIEKGVVKPTDVFNCHHGYYVDPAGRVVRDGHGGYGMLSARDVLVKSSNVGMTQIGWKMGISMMHDAVTSFGFGKRTGVEIPGDQKGIVRPVSQWNKGTMTSCSFGYEVAATPLQLVRMFAVFANGGYLVTPRIISAYEDRPGELKKWEEVAGGGERRQILSGQTCEVMRNIMADVISPRGTVKHANSSYYTLYGKTGTAHIAGRARGDGGQGYGENSYNSSFLCGGPVKNPRLVTIVTMHRPDVSTGYYGGTVSAPTAIAIMERALLYLQVPADKTGEGKR
ncbi:MAG: penicillin-binding protein 2 [Phycisphaerales bacterium]|nr:penicillin-binding protein 2 [Phycisphaerales bacterium]